MSPPSSNINDKLTTMEAVLSKVERYKVFLGEFPSGAAMVPKIRIPDTADDDEQRVLTIMNRIAAIYSRDNVTRVLGPFRESEFETFLENKQLSDRVEMLRNKLNRMRLDLSLVRGVDVGLLDKIEE